MDWSEWFYYDESSPSCLRWKVDVFCGQYKTVLNVAANDVAGTYSNGYYFVRLDGDSYCAHRIVWEILKGKIPEGMFIDHINRERSLNTIDNLRLTTKQHNAQNRNLSSSNHTGMQGVNLRANSKGSEYWEASWQENFKTRCKCFSTRKYGYEAAKTLAIKYRNRMIDILNSTGMLYSESHKTKETNA